jgi:fructose-1,6-bisphosphatase/inositol monophosphatase family enzyme
MNLLDEKIYALLADISKRVILPRYRNLSKHEINQKAVDDLVTVADREAEINIADGLSAIDNTLTIIGEEAAYSDPSLLKKLSGDCWIIDPLDGTHNFAHGNAPFGIIIAMTSGGECQSGWIYDCLSGRFCYAHKGGGAYLNGKVVKAKTTGETKPVAAISRIFLTDEQRNQVDRKIAPHYRLVEIPRCAAEQYPRLALGENDVSSFKRTLAWDHAAGVLWLNEAGGKACRLDGTAYRVDENNISGLVGASSPVIWDAFVDRVLNQ